MKKQLEDQKVEKAKRKAGEKNEGAQYHKQLVGHLELLDQREAEKASQHQAKVRQEKKARDVQLMRNQEKKQKEARDNLE